MPRKAENLYSMARGRVRASMNKYNLFNLYKKPKVSYRGQTIFQQKWTAKQETRAYHGEHLTEGRWKTLFLPLLESVAQLDASLKGVEVAATPMPLQTYAVLEKRLEFALFRAMFASSIRQARQFIQSGHVKVNGVTVKHSSFPLKSGDVFSVTPDKVLLAMGRVKPSVEQAVKTDVRQIAVWNKYVSTAKSSPRDVWELQQARPASLNTLAKTLSAFEAVKKFNEQSVKTMLDKQRKTTRENVLSQILAAANGQDLETVNASTFTGFPSKGDAEKCREVYRILKEDGHELVGNFSGDKCKTYLSTKLTEYATPVIAKTAASVKKILQEIVSSHVEYLRVSSEENLLPDNATKVPYSSEFGKNMAYHAKLDKDAIIENETAASVDLPWQKGLFGRQDPKKPYFTPWTPRPFVGAFAVLPAHIEISFETCHAVYLRDPVARPGHSEVISPFPVHMHERAYMYYARKGL